LATSGDGNLAIDNEVAWGAVDGGEPDLWKSA